MDIDSVFVNVYTRILSAKRNGTQDELYKYMCTMEEELGIEPGTCIQGNSDELRSLAKKPRGLFYLFMMHNKDTWLPEEKKKPKETPSMMGSIKKSFTSLFKRKAEEDDWVMVDEQATGLR